MWSVRRSQRDQNAGDRGYCFTPDLCVSVLLSRSHLFVFAIFSQSRRQAAYVKHTMLSGQNGDIRTHPGGWWCTLSRVGERPTSHLTSIME